MNLPSLLSGTVSALILACSPGLPTAFAADAQAEWPQFRGPAGAACSKSGKPGPIEFGPERNVQWSLELPPGHSSPCISGDKLVLTAFDKSSRKLLTLCVKRSTGALLWTRERVVEKFEQTHNISNPATATPATDGQAVFVYFGSYGIAAFDFEGKELWTQSLPLAVNRMGFGSGTSPIVAGEFVILDVHAGDKSHLLALKCRDGKTAWKAENPKFNEGWSTPIAWREGEEDVVGILNAGRFSAHRLRDGSEKWSLAGLPAQTCATPAVGKGLIFITGTGVLGEPEGLIQLPSFDEVIAHHDTNKDGKISTDELPDSLLVADRKSSKGAGNMSVRRFLSFSTDGKPMKLDRADWEKASSSFNAFSKGPAMSTRLMALKTGGKGDVTETAVAWSETKGVPEVPSPLLVGDRLYLVKAGGVLICRDALNGKAVYEERLGAPGGYYASPVAAGNRIYVASDVGMVVVFEAADTLNVLARNNLKEPIMATPALVDEHLYVRTATRLYAFK